MFLFVYAYLSTRLISELIPGNINYNHDNAHWKVRTNDTWLILGSFPLYSHLCLSTALSYISTLLVTRKDFIFLMLMNQSSLTLNYKRFVLSRVEFCVMNSIINYTPHFQNIIKCWSLQMPLCDCLTTDVRAWMNCIREIDQNFLYFWTSICAM